MPGLLSLNSSRLSSAFSLQESFAHSVVGPSLQIPATNFFPTKAQQSQCWTALASGRGCPRASPTLRRKQESNLLWTLMNNKTFINFNCKRFKLNHCNERINRKLRVKYPFKISYLLSSPSLFTRQSQIKQCTYCLPPIPQDKTLPIYQDAAQIAPQNLFTCKESAHSLHPKAWFWYFWEWHLFRNVLLVLNELSYLPNGITSWASLTCRPQK